jgi:GntR family transcriptional regulator/MocR family aminotransferase
LPFNTGRTLVDARTAEVWRKLMQYAVRSLGARDLGYTDPRGLPELRQCLCEYLRATRGVRCDPEQIVVTAGTQQAMDIAIRILLAPGDEVWVEDPGYPLTYAQLEPPELHVRRPNLSLDDLLRVVIKPLRVTLGGLIGCLRRF